MTGQSLKRTALGKYTLIASLAEGGMAKVYLGLAAGPAGFNKLLVIKVLNRNDTAQPGEDVQLFWDEARLAARLIHPNVVHTYEVGEVEGRYFLAMEYLDGQTYRTLRNRMPSTGLAYCDELRIIVEIAHGLHYAHELRGFKGEPLGVVHRDVSPQNVVVSYDGQVKLLDFGIAKSYDSGHKTQVGVIKGKLDYMAPEQLSGDKVDARADIFALGVMLWEAVGGRAFSGGRGVPDIRKAHARLTGGEPKLREIAPDAPDELVSIVERAIAVDPAQRWADAASMADALDAYIASTGNRPGAKTLSEAMNSLFADERRKMHKLIDQQIDANANHSVSGTTSTLPNLGSGYSITPSGARDFEVTVGSRPGRTPLHPEPPKRVSSNMRSAIAVIAGALIAAVVPSLMMVGTPSTVTPVVTPGKRIDAATAMPANVEPLPPERPENQSPTSVVSASDGVDSKGKASVLLSLRAFPADARVTLDNAEVALPFSGEFERGAAVHQLEAIAKGYEPYRKLISFNSDQRIDIVLQLAQSKFRRSDKRAAQVPAAQVPAAQVPGTTEPDPAAKPLAPGAVIDFVKPTVDPTEIDTVNPFAKPR